MSEPRHQVLFVAPGAGLGHVVRVSALALGLRERGVSSAIVTNSRYAEGLSRLLELTVFHVPTEQWQRCRELVAESAPRLVVLDTFPFGFRGEWCGPATDGLRFAYLARRLKVQAYLTAIGRDWDADTPSLARMLVVEPLTGEHAALLHAGGGELVELPGRIRFPAGAVEGPIPAELADMLRSGPADLVVHSGPRLEVDALLQRARALDGAGRFALILPKPIAGLDLPTFEYFPASRLFPLCRRIVTGGGYNAVAECAEFADRHVVVPFDRHYDDQHGRVAAPAMSAVDGTRTAVETLLGWL